MLLLDTGCAASACRTGRYPITTVSVGFKQTPARVRARGKLGSHGAFRMMLPVRGP